MWRCSDFSELEAPYRLQCTVMTLASECCFSCRHSETGVVHVVLEDILPPCMTTNGPPSPQNQTFPIHPKSSDSALGSPETRIPSPSTSLVSHYLDDLPTTQPSRILKWGISGVPQVSFKDHAPLDDLLG